MTSNMSGTECTEGDSAGYEAPILVQIGNLHDLLATGGSANCDQGDLNNGTGIDNLCL